MNHSKNLFLVVGGMLILSLIRCSSQTPLPDFRNSGIIEGKVTDSTNGNPIEGVLINLLNSEMQTKTNSNGDFRLENIPPGNYTIRAQVTGYAPENKSVSVTANFTSRIDFKLQPLSSSGTTFYVSVSGSDSNPGTREKPWASVGFASRQLQPGDTLIILGGKYCLQRYDDDIISPSSGRADAWIVIKGEETKRPQLACGKNLLTAINLSGTSYIRIENLEITHDSALSGYELFFRDGIEILGTPANHIVLKDLYIHHLDEFGINIQDINDLQIINCRIEFCGFGAIGGPAGMEGGWKNVCLQNCHLSYSGHYYQGGNGTNRPYDRPDGLGIEASAGPLIIENSLIEHNYGDGLDSKVENTLITKSIIANNSCDGIKLWGTNSKIENCLIYGRGDSNSERTPWSAIVIDQVETPGASFELVNVTVDDHLGNNYLFYAQYSSSTPIKVLLRNVIFSARGPNSQIYIGNSVTLSADHNLFYFPQTGVVLEHGAKLYTQANIDELGEGNIYGDPYFIMPVWGTNGDYHLKDKSPAVDRGTADSAPSLDLDGKPRPQGKGFDIGSYEK